MVGFTGCMAEGQKQRTAFPARPIASADGLLLTPLQRSDADAMLEVLQDSQLYDFMGGEPPSVDDLRRRYDRQASGVSPDGSQLWLNWIVRVHGVPAGYVQATVAFRDVPLAAELAWVIGIRWQGQGLATRSARLVQAWLHDRGVHRFTASIHPAHAASAAVASYLGLRPTDAAADNGEVIWRMP